MIKTTPKSLRMLWYQSHIPFLGLLSCAPAACKIKKDINGSEVIPGHQVHTSSRWIVSDDQNVDRTTKNQMSSRETTLYGGPGQPTPPPPPPEGLAKTHMAR